MDVLSFVADTKDFQKEMKGLIKFFKSYDRIYQQLLYLSFDDFLKFKIDPTWYFDFRQYMLKAEYSEYYQMRSDEPFRFSLFLRYGARRILI